MRRRFSFWDVVRLEEVMVEGKGECLMERDGGVRGFDAVRISVLGFS
jgi:hypothetical protein